MFSSISTGMCSIAKNQKEGARIPIAANFVASQCNWRFKKSGGVNAMIHAAGMKISALEQILHSFSCYPITILHPSPILCVCKNFELLDPA
jgi:hypothetical protein